MPTFHQLTDADGTAIRRRPDGVLGMFPAQDAETLVVVAATDGCDTSPLLIEGAGPIALNAGSVPAPLLALRSEPAGSSLFRLRMKADGSFLAQRDGGILSANAAESMDAALFRLGAVTEAPANGTLIRLDPGLRFDRDGLRDLFSAAEPATLPLVEALLPFLSVADGREAWRDSHPSPARDAFFGAVRAQGWTQRPQFGAYTADLLRVQAERYGWSIGAGSYGMPRIIEAGRGRLVIGAFCSFAEPSIVLGNHETRTGSTYPFVDLWSEWPGTEPGMTDHVSRDVVIGSDVWIGIGAIVLPGAVIGDGAVIGAGAVVRGTVPPYAICIGNPATVVRKRFDDRTIARLLRLRWWDWPDAMVDRYLPQLLSRDLQPFLSAAEAELGLTPLAGTEPVLGTPAHVPERPADAAAAPRPGWLRWFGDRGHGEGSAWRTGSLR